MIGAWYRNVLLTLSVTLVALPQYADCQAPLGMRYSAGYGRAFGHGGPAGEIGVDVLRTSISPRLDIVAGVAGWGIQTDVFSDSPSGARRQVYGFGPTIEACLGQPASAWQFHLSATLHRVVTVNDDFVWLIDTEIPDYPEEVNPGTRKGWGYGAGAGASLRLSSRLRTRIDYTVLRQRIFTSSAGAVPRVQVGVVWNYQPNEGH